MIKGYARYEAVDAVGILYRRMRNLFNVSVSEDEVFTYCVKPEDAEIMRAALLLGMRREHLSQHLAYNTNRYSSQIPMPNLWPFIPKYVTPTYAAEKLAGTNIAQEIDACVDKLFPLAEQWTSVKWVLELLLDECKTWAQVRSVMPGIVPLLVAGGAVDKANELRDANGTPRTPALPPSCLQALREANLLIARASLITEQARPKNVVQLHLDGRVTLPWLEGSVSILNRE